MAETDRKLLPPYVPARTFLTFLDHLHAIGPMPSHIDNDVMRSLSGGMRSWMKSSLRYMKLIDAADVPTPALTKLVKATGDERKTLLRELFRNTYAFLDDKVDLKNTTPQKLRAAFAELGAQGETVEKAVAFLTGLGKEAGIDLSPYITKRATGGRRRAPARSTVPRSNGDAGRNEEGEGALRPPGSQSDWTEQLLAKFPSFDPSWPDEIKSKWFEGFERLMSARKT